MKAQVHISVSKTKTLPANLPTYVNASQGICWVILAFNLIINLKLNNNAIHSGSTNRHALHSYLLKSPPTRSWPEHILYSSIRSKSKLMYMPDIIANRVWNWWLKISHLDFKKTTYTKVTGACMLGWSAYLTFLMGLGFFLNLEICFIKLPLKPPEMVFLHKIAYRAPEVVTVQ